MKKNKEINININKEIEIYKEKERYKDKCKAEPAGKSGRRVRGYVRVWRSYVR